MRVGKLTLKKNRPDTLLKLMNGTTNGQWQKRGANAYQNPQLAAQVFVCRNDDFKKEYHLHTQHRKEVHVEPEALQKALKRLQMASKIKG